MPHNQRNFWIANTVNAIFFSGYFILKFPLAFILSQQGFALSKAYSLTTTTTIALALCSLALTWAMKNYHNQKHVFLLGIVFNFIAAILLETGQYYLEILGLGCYVIGASLYFFNITLLFNKQFNTPRDRLHGNYLAQICLNMGAFVGTIIFLIAISTGQHYFIYTIYFMGASLLILLICYRLLKDDAVSKKQQLHLYFNCLIMLFFALLCLQFNCVTRWVVLGVFSIALMIALKQSYQYHERGYFIFILLVLLFSLPFWIGNTILYNQFFFFLHDNVMSFFTLPATAIILLDPLSNIIFGIIWTRMTRNSTQKPYANLLIGMLLVAIAFSALTIGLYGHHHADKISAGYPMIALILFACAQFLIQPTMHSRVTDLIANHQRMVFALGVLRAVRSVAAILAFYLITFTVTANKMDSFHHNQVLYGSVTAMACLSIVIFLVIKNQLQLRDVS